MSNIFLRLIKAIRTKFFKIQGRNNQLDGINRGGISIVRGDNNTIKCETKPLGSKIWIYGSNNTIEISEDVVFKSGKIWIEDSNNKIKIGKGTTIEEAELAVAEHGTSIVIGCDCMLSSGIRISTTDSHSIIDNETKSRINPAKDVVIDDHVWIGHNVSICKGVHIGHDVIIGTNSVVTHDIPPSVVVAGVPARVVRANVTWDRKRI